MSRLPKPCGLSLERWLSVPETQMAAQLTGRFRRAMFDQVHIGRIVFWGLAGFGLLLGQQNSLADPELQQHLAAAREAERAQDFARAGAEYQKILRLQPKLAIIHQSLALTYHLRNQFDEAIPEFNRAIQLDPNLWGSFLFLGMDFYKTNQFEKAITALDKSVNLNAAQAEPEARFWLGASKAALGRPEEAVGEYRRAAELRPKDIEVLYALANTYDQAAAAVFQNIGHIERRAAAVSLLQAEHFLSEKRADLAGIEYRHAVLLRPDFEGAIPALDKNASSAASEDTAITESDARASFALGRYWLWRGEAVKSSALLTHLAKMKPADENARRYIVAAQQASSKSRMADDAGPWPALFEARGYVESNEFAHAEEVLRKLLNDEPRNLDALLSLGKVYKKWAATLLDKMIELNADSYRVHQLFGQKYEEGAEYDQALQSYKTALAIQPELAGMRYAIGNVYWKKRQYDDAEHWLKEELKRNPHHGITHYRLGSLYTDEGKADEAITHLERALESHPGLTAARFDLGRALLSKGRYADAVSALNKVAAEEPANDRVHYFISNCYSKMGRSEEARAEMAKYQELTRKRLELAQQDVRDASHSLEKNK